MSEENSTENISELRQQRIQKLNHLKELDIDVYPARFNREAKISEVKEKYFQQEEIPEEPWTELEKAVNRLLPYEVKELYFWLREFTLNKPELHPCLAVVKNHQ